MNIKQLSIRFLILYLGLLALSGVFLYYAGQIGEKTLNTPILFGCVAGMCQWFYKSNGRTFDPQETKLAIMAMWIIDQMISVLLVVPGLMLGEAAIHAGALVGAFIFMAVLHLLFIAGTVYLMKHAIEKAESKKVNEAH